MPDNDLYAILGRVYGAKVLHRGDIATITADFRLACDSPAFLNAAKTRKGELEGLSAKMGGHSMRERDIIGATQLDFLREALAGL